MTKFVAWQVVSLMKNEPQSQNLLLKVDPRSTFRNKFLDHQLIMYGEKRETSIKTCNEMYAAVFYRPRHAIVPREYNGRLSVFPSNKPRVVSGSQPKRSSKIVESSE